VNSINGKQKSIDTILPLLKRFGCFVVALCLDESGIHIESEKRIEAGEKLLKILKSEGIANERVFIDSLMLAESAEPGSAMETLKVIEHFAKRGIKTSLGLSNISFGLPQRKNINNVYLKMAMEKGLTASIINPSTLKIIESLNTEEALAFDFLTGNDPGAAKYIKHFKEESGTQSTIAKKEEATDQDIISQIFNTVVEGNVDEITESIEEALKDHEPAAIMDRGLLKALEKVGDLYSTGEYFLPQMIASANAMKKGFLKIKPILSKESAAKLGKIIICTVKGDIHDIGKNIVAMMMENHGFEVHDLGKDVPSETIIEKAEKIDADIICLSSLLTTTMGEMKTVSEAIKEKNLRARLLIGGAVVNDEYAASIGAHYSEDAVEGVKRAKELLGK